MKDYVQRLRGEVGSDWLLQLPSVTVALWDSDDRLLLARRAAHESWLLPGGAIEPGESPADAALREAWEETGLHVRLTGLVGVFGGTDFIIEYEDQERTSYVMTVFEAGIAGGELSTPSDELLEARFLPPSEVRQQNLAAWVPAVLPAVLARRPSTAAFEPPTWQPPR